MNETLDRVEVGGKWYRATGEIAVCDGCFFKDDPKGCTTLLHSTKCIDELREDRRNVIWVEEPSHE